MGIRLNFSALSHEIAWRGRNRPLDRIAQRVTLQDLARLDSTCFRGGHDSLSLRLVCMCQTVFAVVLIGSEFRVFHYRIQHDAKDMRVPEFVAGFPSRLRWG